MYRGDYWIIDNRAKPVDATHSRFASDFIAKDYVEDVIAYAKKLGIDTSNYSELSLKSPGYVVHKLMSEIFYAFPDLKVSQRGETEEKIMGVLGINRELYDALAGTMGMPYVMKNFNWMAIRNRFIELFGINYDKAQVLFRVLSRMIENGGIEADEDSTFTIDDHKTGRRIDVSLDDLREGNFFKANKIPMGPSPYYGQRPKYWSEALVLDFKNFCLKI